MIFPLCVLAFLFVSVIIATINETLTKRRQQQEKYWDAIEADESLYVTQWFAKQCKNCNANAPRSLRRFNSRISIHGYGGPSLLRLAENKGPLLPEGEVITLQRCFTCGAVWRVRQYGVFRRKA
jgi:hypothetical protein